jgi:hypothetical protein
MAASLQSPTSNNWNSGWWTDVGSGPPLTTIFGSVRTVIERFEYEQHAIHACPPQTGIVATFDNVPITARTQDGLFILTVY